MRGESARAPSARHIRSAWLLPRHLTRHRRYQRAAARPFGARPTSTTRPCRRAALDRTSPGTGGIRHGTRRPFGHTSTQEPLMSTAAPFAFLVHPRARIAEDLARVWRPLGRVPEALRRRGGPQAAAAAVRDVARAAGPVAGRSRRARAVRREAPAVSEPHEGRARVGRAIDHAARLGAGVVGLGALTATVTAGRRDPAGADRHRRHQRQRVHGGDRRGPAAGPAGRPRPSAASRSSARPGSVGTTLVRLLAAGRVGRLAPARRARHGRSSRRSPRRWADGCRRRRRRTCTTCAAATRWCC